MVLKQDTPGLASVVLILARSRVKRRNQVYTRSGGVGHERKATEPLKRRVRTWALRGTDVHGTRVKNQLEDGTGSETRVLHRGPGLRSDQDAGAERIAGRAEGSLPGLETIIGDADIRESSLPHHSVTSSPSHTHTLTHTHTQSHQLFQDLPPESE